MVPGPRPALVVGALATSTTVVAFGAALLYLRHRRRRTHRRGATPRAKLRLLVTTDTHSALLPSPDQDGNLIGGAPQRAWELARQREACAREGRECLTLDNGDAFQGTPFYSFYKGEIDMQAMNMMKYDVMSVGNHDLDHGIENLKRASAFAPNTRVVCANVVREESGETIWEPYHIVEVGGGVKVAIVGIMGRGAWSCVGMANRGGAVLVDPVEAATKARHDLDRLGGVGVVVCLSHSGVPEDTALIECGAFDVIFGGHDHIPGFEHATHAKNGTTYHHGDANGHSIAGVDLEVGEDGAIKCTSSFNIPVSPECQQGADKAMENWLQTIARGMESKLQEKVCTNLFGIETKGAMDPRHRIHSPPVRLLAEAARRHYGTDIGIMNNGGVRSGLRCGPVTVGDVEKFYPFDSTISTCVMAEWFLGTVIRRNAEVLCTPDAHFGYGFVGLDYTIHPSRELGAATVHGGATTLRLHRPETLTDTLWLRVAVPSYTLHTTIATLEGYAEGVRDVVDHTDVTHQQSFLALLKAHGQVGGPEESGGLSRTPSGADLLLVSPDFEPEGGASEG